MQPSFRLCHPPHRSYLLLCGLYSCYSGAGSSVLFNASEVSWAGLWNRASPFLTEDFKSITQEGGITACLWLCFRPKSPQPSFVWGPNTVCEHCLEKDPLKSISMSFLCLTDTYRGSREQAGWSGAVTGIERNRSPRHWSPAEQGLKSHHSAWRRKAPPYAFCFQGPRECSTKGGTKFFFVKSWPVQQTQRGKAYN